MATETAKGRDRISRLIYETAGLWSQTTQSSNSALPFLSCVISGWFLHYAHVFVSMRQRWLEYRLIGWLGEITRHHETHLLLMCLPGK